MKRIIFWSFVSLLIAGVAGCGEDTSDHAGPEIIVPGLSGDTYFSTKFGIRISDLPVEQADQCTVKELGSDGKGIRMQSEYGFIPLYCLLLIEYVPADQFVGPDANGNLSPVVAANIPFICIAVNYEKDGDFETHDLKGELEWFAAAWSYEIESIKAVSVGDGNATGMQAVLSQGDEKQIVTWFAKGEIQVRCEYWGKEADFDKYFISYVRVVESIWLMGE